MGCGMVIKFMNPKIVKIIPITITGIIGFGVFSLILTNPAITEARA